MMYWLSVDMIKKQPTYKIKVTCLLNMKLGTNMWLLHLPRGLWVDLHHLVYYICHI